jgi:Ca2+-binding EF-hand superfamily protein
MGNSIKKNSNFLKSNELNEFHNMTSLSEDILIKLHEHYRKFSAIQTDDGVIDYIEFYTLIGKTNTILTKRIFDSIDCNKDGFINFREFLKFLSCFDTGSLEEQIKISFSLMKDSSEKIININSMKILLKESIYLENDLKIIFDDNTIDFIVDETFNKYIDKGTYSANESESNSISENIDYGMYSKIVRENPEILIWFKINFNNLKNVKINQKNKKKLNCFGK